MTLVPAHGELRPTLIGSHTESQISVLLTDVFDCSDPAQKVAACECGPQQLLAISRPALKVPHHSQLKLFPVPVRDPEADEVVRVGGGETADRKDSAVNRPIGHDDFEGLVRTLTELNLAGLEPAGGKVGTDVIVTRG